MADAPVTAQHIAKAIEDDYSQYVATAPIYGGTALYYREGDPVPASNVKAHKYDELGLVAKQGTKAAAAVVPTPADNQK